MPRPIGTGKKKIEIKFVEDRRKRSVAFSKRKAGLFRAAEKLCSDMGGKIAVVAFTPSGNLFKCGSDQVIVDYLYGPGRQTEESHDQVIVDSSSSLYGPGQQASSMEEPHVRPETVDASRLDDDYIYSILDTFSNF